jgi:hypothetical protein
MAGSSEITKVVCKKCGGGPRNHSVIAEENETLESPDGDITVWKCFQIVKCLGCETIRFLHTETCSEAPEESEVHVYPESQEPKRYAVDSRQFPADVSKMYVETVIAFNSGTNTLAGGGLRATVEAICKDQKVAGGNLKDRIDNLVKQGVLAKAQADFLHEGRLIGNEALHEMKTPTDQDIEDGLKIVEGMLNTIYVLPSHAARLKGKRAPTNPAIPASPPTIKTTK